MSEWNNPSTSNNLENPNLSTFNTEGENSQNLPANNPPADRSYSIIDPIWETLDPNPDPQILYNQFNKIIFGGTLPTVDVKWSNRMTRSTGVCYHSLNKSGDCIGCRIRLSKKILELRRRKDMVESLLHEMIHVLLCSTNNMDPGDDHGPNFRLTMEVFNNSFGTNITISHTFYEEVEAIKRHWWECDGPCQNVVKRATNRAPSSKERWFREHEQTCGGSFIKTSEPEGPARKRRRT
eukprot:XP_012808209.1 PREDICTED: sprT-like domain-containing protein Spartan [Xenopus tropicalis]